MLQHMTCKVDQTATRLDRAANELDRLLARAEDQKRGETLDRKAIHQHH